MTRNYFVARLLTLGLLKAVIFTSTELILTNSSSAMKSFLEVSFPLHNNEKLCAVGAPSAILTVSELRQEMPWQKYSLPLSRVPAEVLCADRCTTKPNCTEFVYKYDIHQCHLYNYSSTCQPQNNSRYFVVRIYKQHSTSAICVFSAP